MTQWEVELVGGNEVPDHPVPGTRSYTVNAQARDAKGTLVAEVKGVEAIANRNGVSLDKEALLAQVQHDEHRRFLKNRIKGTLRDVGEQAEPREFRSSSRPKMA